MTIAKTIHEEWSTVYLNSHKSKAHLFDGCKYVKDVDSEDLAKYPYGHLEFCTECVEYFKAWRENTTGSKDQCQRCGQKDVKNTYCMECFSKIRHKKAKNRL